MYPVNSIYGYYVRQEDLFNGRPWYKHDDGNSIWWIDDKLNVWMLGGNKQQNGGFAYLPNSERCLPKIPNQNWKGGEGGSTWNDAGNSIKARCGYKPKGI